jgi:nickel/cobalt transporter (NiCoT) family protein
MTTSAVAAPSRLAQFRASLTTGDKRSLAGMLSFIVLLHALGFVVLLALIAAARLSVGR